MTNLLSSSGELGGERNEAMLSVLVLAKSDGRLTKNELRYQAENAGTAGVLACTR